MSDVSGQIGARITLAGAVLGVFIGVGINYALVQRYKSSNEYKIKVEDAQREVPIINRELTTLKGNIDEKQYSNNAELQKLRNNYDTLEFKLEDAKKVAKGDLSRSGLAEAVIRGVALAGLGGVLGRSITGRTIARKVDPSYVFEPLEFVQAL